MVEIGQTVAERFDLLRLASSGGMGAVYEARDLSTGDIVALKIQFAEASAERFLREAELLASLSHPNIVRYIAHGLLPDGTQYLAMEWLDGEDLHHRLARGTLSSDEALQLAVSVASALSVAHEKNVIHRDIKPANLFLVGGSTANLRVLDFGIARHRPHDAKSPHTATQTGFVVGTIGYMAPEQAAGASAITPSVDVFALGCVLYECLTGRAAFYGDHAVAVLAKLLCDSVAPMRSIRSEVAPALDHLVLSMLSKSPEQRPADGRAMLAELERVERLDELTGTRKSVFTLELSADGASTERRYIAYLLVAPPDLAAMDRTESTEISLRETEVASEIARRYGATVTTLANRTYLVRVSGFASATDTARVAADCGLAFMNAAVHRVAIAMAPSAVGTKDSVGVALDRAAALLAMYKDEPRSLVIVDDVVEGLLDARYVLDRQPRTQLQSVIHAQLDPAQRVVVRGTILRSHERDREARAVLGQPLPCVGRERELNSLGSLLSECVDESVCRVAVVLGAPGIGKSRLRAEFVKRALLQQPSLQSVHCVASALGARVQWETVRNLLKAHVESLERPWSAWCEAQSLRNRTIVSLLFSDVDPHLEIDGAFREALRDNAAFFAEQLERLVAEQLQSVLQSRPLLVAFDDLHFGDLVSVQLLENVFRRLKDRPLMVLALGRDELTKTFGDLWSSRGAQVFRISPLSRKMVEKLFRQVLGAAFEQQNSLELVDRAEGNPLFVEELIRAAAEGGQQHSPESLVAVMQSRMEKLPAIQRQILYVMSVFFVRSTVAMVASVLTDQSIATLQGQFAELCSGEWLCPEEGQQYRFTHGLVRDSAYQSMNDHERASIHQVVADTLGSLGRTPAIVLAEHYRLGGAMDRAAALYASAAEDSANGPDTNTTHAIADAGLALVTDPIVKGRLLVAKLSAYWLSGNTDLGLPLARESFELLRESQSPQKYVALARWCTCSVDLRIVDQTDASIRALPEAPEPGLEPDWWIAYARIGFAAEIGGRRDVSERFFLRASDHLARCEGTTAREINALFHFVQGMRTSFGFFEKRILSYQSRIANSANDSVIERLGQLHGTGWSYMQVGEWEAAVDTFDAGILLAEREGYEITRATWLMRATGAIALAEVGNFDKALSFVRMSYQWSQQSNATRLRGTIAMYYARVMQLMGDIEPALAMARGSIPEFKGPVPMQAAALATQAELARRVGAFEEALDCTERAMVIAAAAKGLEQDELYVYLQRIESLVAVGEREQAQAVLERAYQMLASNLEKFTNSHWRHSYLHRLRENARLMALYDELHRELGATSLR